MITKRIKAEIAKRLHFFADRLDPDMAFRHASGLSFTLEQGQGFVLRADGKGCPVWYYGHADYDRAHSEADSPT